MFSIHYSKRGLTRLIKVFFNLNYGGILRGSFLGWRGEEGVGKITSPPV